VILRRVLIANRGEIAVRVLRTCRRLGIETVLAVAAADADSVPARLADQTIALGGAGYLDVAAVVAAARTARADAIHPGYGFLAENPRLARACEAAGIVFIGPGAGVLEAAGDKLAARNHAAAAGLPELPGGTVGDAVPDGADGVIGASGADEARSLAGRIGFPVLVKAAGGGGGEGCG
jgi:acetyl-CoA carboxylase, biotin carboxylase subunit